MEAVVDRDAHRFETAPDRLLLAPPERLSHAHEDRAPIDDQHRVMHVDRIGQAGERGVVADHLCARVLEQSDERRMFPPSPAEVGSSGVVPEWRDRPRRMPRRAGGRAPVEAASPWIGRRTMRSSLGADARRSGRPFGSLRLGPDMEVGELTNRHHHGRGGSEAVRIRRPGECEGHGANARSSEPGRRRAGRPRLSQ